MSEKIIKLKNLLNAFKRNRLNNRQENEFHVNFYSFSLPALSR
jgi:hypothetical protein